jgi:hypothetical protein
MKGYLLLLLIIPTIVSSQWRYQVSSDPFEGETKLGWVVGTGGEFPYSNPEFIFRSRDNNLQVYIDKLGYVKTGDKIQFSFGNPNEIIDLALSESSDNSAGFLTLSTLEDFINTLNDSSLSYIKRKSVYDALDVVLNETEKIAILINKLKSESIVYVRFMSELGDINRFRFSLSNSTNVLNKVIGDYMQNQLINYNKIKAFEKVILEEDNMVAKRLASKRTKFYDLIEQLPKLRRPIKQEDLETYTYKILDIDSLTYKPEDKYPCFLDIYVWYRGNDYKISGGARQMTGCNEY